MTVTAPDDTALPPAGGALPIRPPLPLAIVVGLAIGAGIDVLSGLLVAKVGVPGTILAVFCVAISVSGLALSGAAPWVEPRSKAQHWSRPSRCPRWSPGVGRPPGGRRPITPIPAW